MLSAFTPRLDGAGNAVMADPPTITAPVGWNAHQSPLLSLRESLRPL